MRIVIDMQGGQTDSRFRGIGRYTMSFAQAVVRNRGEHEIILALSGLFPDTIEPIRAAFDGLLPQENIRIWHAPGPVSEGEPGNESRREVAELLREAFLSSLRPDVVHISSLFEGYVDDAVTSIGRFDRSTPVSVTLYDLIPLLNPDHYLKPNPRYAQYYQRKIDNLKQAAAFLAISESARQEGIAHLGVSERKAVNVSTAIEPHFQPHTLDGSTACELGKFGITRPFVLYSGGADDRKNLPRLIEAYAALPSTLRDGHQLVFAGKMPEPQIAQFRQIGKSVGLKDSELIFTGYVSDEELVRLYNLCRLFVFPSWHEGFGLPALEAMACGAPVIGANTSSLPEVIGLNAAMFDPFDVAAIAAKMAQALGDDVFRDTLREHGMQQVKKFSWDETAKLALNVFEQLARRGCRSSPFPSVHSDELVQDLIGAIAQLGSGVSSSLNMFAIAAALAQNHPEPSRQRKLFVDISELVQRDFKTGVQRVTRAILRELLLAPPEGYEVRAVYAEMDQYGYRFADNYVEKLFGKGGGKLEDMPIDTQPGDVFLGLDLQHSTTRVQECYLSDIRNNGAKVWFVVYDLLPIQFPHYWPTSSIGEMHQEWLGVVTKFDGVACISKAVADELADWLKANGDERARPLHIGWFHLGADIESSEPSLGMPGDANEVFCALQAKPSFLMVGTLEPRKGHAQVLAAFERLWETGIDANLVIVGKQGWLVESMVERLRVHPELKKRLFWLDGVSDEYLEQVYAASTCLIAASYGEGFGLPLIEAAQHKLPIIARDIPVFREVAGEHAFYFLGESPEDLAAALGDWLKRYASGTYPKSDAMPWLTWKESAAQLLSALLGPADKPGTVNGHATFLGRSAKSGNRAENSADPIDGESRSLEQLAS